MGDTKRAVLLPCFQGVIWDDPSCRSCPHHYSNYPEKTRREWNRELSRTM